MRIRIPGSVPLTNGSGSGFGMPKNIPYGSYGSGTMVKSYEVKKQVFLNILLDDGRIRSWIRIREAQ
jgi:hypothetical protein